MLSFQGFTFILFENKLKDDHEFLRLKFSWNNLLSYCGLVDTRIRTFEKDLPVHLEISEKCLRLFTKLLTILHCCLHFKKFVISFL